MDYERIQKPQGGGFSPRRLREMLLGIEKQRKEEEELEEIGAGFDLRSDDGDVEFRGADATKNFKDVDMVSSHPEHSTSLDFNSVYKSRDGNLANSRVWLLETESLDSESVSSSVFEFHKTPERIPHRSPAYMPPFSKPTPSKWDDAEKWIASPTSSRTTKSSTGGKQQKKSSLGGHGNKSFGSRVLLEEVTDEVDTKRMDPSIANKDYTEQKTVSWVPELFHAVAMDDKPSSHFENPFADSAITMSRHDSSTAVQSATALLTPPSTVKSVSMRDTGTEMTPLASQEPSRTGTPKRSTTPTHSPNSSRPLSPTRIEQSSIGNESDVHLENFDHKELSEKELKLKTRREIMVLGQQLGKMSIAAWASKEEEERDATVSGNPPAITVNEARAVAWEEAEKVKYLARFKQEEIKIQAWENHQKAKTEAEMRRIEVEIEKMRARAQEKLMNHLATARHKAEEKRVAAEAKRNRQATRTAQRAEYIIKTGHIPSSSVCWGWCS